MLKLKKLQILGFKSFCDRTELKFHGEGIAAIIGPNGCGKSNIADAISWVLGEQSAKTLRGARMEDVIFAGTRDRNPTGMAEVSLTLIDPEIYDGADTNAPTEIEIQDDICPTKIGTRRSCARKPPRRPSEPSEEAQPERPKRLKAEATQPRRCSRSAEAPEPAIRRRRQLRADDVAVAAERGPQVVLKIRRRKFNQQQHHARGDPRHAPFVPQRRQRISAERKALPAARHSGNLHGHRLGPESYALIEQGRIGQILSSRPTDRRAIIEEAAGITKFKTKKRLAEARLEEAKQNLNRMNDIFEEVTRQMNSLKRQASKGRALCQAAGRDARQAARGAGQQVRADGSGERRARCADQQARRRDSPADRRRAAVRG